MARQSGLARRLRREQLAHNPNVLRKIELPRASAWARGDRVDIPWTRFSRRP